MDKELLSIREFAKASGRSRQAVYQQLSTALKNYVTEKDGQKYIKAIALSEVYELELDKALQSIDSQVDSQPVKLKETAKPDTERELIKELYSRIDSLDSQIDSLYSQLTVKDKQIEKLNAAIEQLTANTNQLTIVLSQQQALHMEHIKQLEDKQAEQDQPEQEEAKRHWWQRKKKN